MAKMFIVSFIVLHVFSAMVDGAPAPDFVSFLKEVYWCGYAVQAPTMLVMTGMCLQVGSTPKSVGEMNDYFTKCCMENCDMDVYDFCVK